MKVLAHQMISTDIVGMGGLVTPMGDVASPFSPNSLLTIAQQREGMRGCWNPDFPCGFWFLLMMVKEE